MREKTEVEKTAETISNFVNRYSTGHIDDLAAAMANDHPTLQQLQMRLCLQFIREMAAKSYVDARNEGSREVARRIVGLLDKEPESLPFI